MQMIDGFNAGWIDFPNRGANARKGCIGIDQAIATMIQRALMNQPTASVDKRRVVAASLLAPLANRSPNCTENVPLDRRYWIIMI